MKEFTKFNQSHPLLLYPAYGIQQTLRAKVLGVSFWEKVTKNREKCFEGKQITEILDGRTIHEYRKAFEEFATQERYNVWRECDRNTELEDKEREERKAARRRKREKRNWANQQRAQQRQSNKEENRAENLTKELKVMPTTLPAAQRKSFLQKVIPTEA